MKSNLQDLIKRGYVDTNKLDNNSLSDCELLEWLHSKEATKRTMAAYYLTLNEENIKQLLLQLKKEKALYTRLAICNKLSSGDELCVNLMIKELGQIGHNQYQELPLNPSKKISYPLPRDIIARSLAHMNPDVFKHLIANLKTSDLKQIRELIDSIGFMAFYHPQLNTLENREYIYQLLEDYQDDIIKWKVITCLSAFPSDKTLYYLNRYLNDSTIIGKEAKRSLQLIKLQMSNQ